MEEERIKFLIQRDGREATCQWVESTLALYRTALINGNSHASLPHYRPYFEEAIHEFEDWLNLCGYTPNEPDPKSNTG